MQHRKLIATSAVVVMMATATFVVIETNAFTLINGFPAAPARYAYAVKFLCNVLGADPNSALAIGLAPGFYYTDINVHNPSFLKSNETLLKKFVLATPELRSQAGAKIPYMPAYPTPYALQTVILGPDAAMRIDCTEILDVLFPLSTHGNIPTTTAKGYVMIYTTKPIAAPGLLDVWVEYSTQGASTCSTTTPTGMVCDTAPSLEVVQVQPSIFVP